LLHQQPTTLACQCKILCYITLKYPEQFFTNPFNGLLPHHAQATHNTKFQNYNCGRKKSYFYLDSFIYFKYFNICPMKTENQSFRNLALQKNYSFIIFAA